MTSPSAHAPGEVPWPALHAVLHEARSPLTVAAYASEILLDAGRTLTAQAIRQHLECIHHACHETSSCITLLSRCMEVEQAGRAPLPEPFPVDAFRDPEAQVPGPAIDGGSMARMDARLAGHFATTLWELASLLPGERPVLASIRVEVRQLLLGIRAHGALASLLTGADAPQPRRRRHTASPVRSFPTLFRAQMARRCLALLGGGVEWTGGAGSEILVRIPVHPAPQRRARRPSPTRLAPCK